MKTGCSVTVVYEDEGRRQEAMQLCDRLVERFWAGGALEVNWCSFEELGAPDSAEEALRKASQADVVVFAACSQNGLPLEVSHWIERWLAQRGSREGILVGLLAPGASGEVAERHLHLRKIAHRGGMDYLTGLPEYVAHHIPDSFESCHERAHRVTNVLDEILHHPPRPPHLVS
jgi:hypothetical protein